MTGIKILKILLVSVVISTLVFFPTNYASAQNTRAMDFEEDLSQYLTIVDSASISITGDMTIEAWVKPEGLGDFSSIVAKFDFGVPKKSYAFGHTSADELRLTISSDGSAETAVASASTLSTGSWQHMAVTYDASGGSAKWYKDGSYLSGEDDSGLPNSINDNDTRLLIGALDNSASATDFFDGIIDEVRIWNDIRTATEISDNYLRELNGGEAGLVAYYKLNNSLLDETSNSNDATNNNSATFVEDVPFVGTRIMMVS